MSDYQECTTCDSEPVTANGNCTNCPIIYGFGPPPDCWFNDDRCLYHDRTGRCFYVKYENSIEVVDCDPAIYDVVAASSNVDVTSVVDEHGDVTFAISVGKYTFKGGGIASVQDLPDGGLDRCVTISVPPPPPPPDPCAVGTLNNPTCDTDIMVCHDGQPYRMNLGCATKTKTFDSVAAGIAGTVTGQSFCVGCAVYQNCNCVEAKLINLTELQYKNFGWIYSHHFQPGDVVGDETITPFCASQFGLPDCINAVYIKIEVTFCHRLMGEFDDQNVTWSLVGNAGGGHWVRSARFCSQSVRDLSDSAVNTAWVPTDANGCFKLTTGIQGDLGFVYEQHHPENFASVRYALLGAGVTLRGDGEWERVGVCK